jgi:hypothetical protein
MTHEEWDGLDPARSRLRALVARVDAEVDRLATPQRADSPERERDVTALTQNWRDLVGALALGEEPTLRACPHCQRRVPLAATRCRYCMRQSAAGAEL